MVSLTSYLCGQFKAENGSGKDLQLDTYFLIYCIRRCFSVGMNLVMVGNFFMPFIFSWRYLEHHKYPFRDYLYLYLYLYTNKRPNGGSDGLWASYDLITCYSSSLYYDLMFNDV